MWCGRWDLLIPGFCSMISIHIPPLDRLHHRLLLYFVFHQSFVLRALLMSIAEPILISLVIIPFRCGRRLCAQRDPAQLGAYSAEVDDPRVFPREDGTYM